MPYSPSRCSFSWLFPPKTESLSKMKVIRVLKAWHAGRRRQGNGTVELRDWVKTTAV
ncbi:hypothetical protein HPP92_001853 [Vanilla planifolia]|uniref:Uncharacterized protein n=1 Tax=Vanilla planifolia TaxID=51239 RepID=A0A835S528_VANPL|nr:hypothetical protein HPP92_001853 [Vanilla planifolia]